MAILPERLHVDEVGQLVAPDGALAVANMTSRFAQLASSSGSGMIVVMRLALRRAAAG